MLRKDGAIIYCEAHGGRSEYNGRPAILGTLLDITERKKAEDARDAAEAWYRCLVEQSLVGTYVIQGDRFIYVNPKMAEIFGFSEVEMTTAPVTKFVHEEDRALVKENIRRRVTGEVESIHYSTRALHKSGKVIYVEVHGRAAEYNGQPAVFGTLLDITERRLAESESERRHKELQFILDAVPALVFYKDREGRFIRVNRELANLVGISPDEFIGRTDAELGSTDGEKYRADDLHVINTGQPLRKREERLETATGIRWLLTDKLPYRDENGNITGVIGFAVDITERKLAEGRALWLASFPERNPTAILEFDISGGLIHYINPSALAQFPDLPAKGLLHPLIAGIKELEADLAEEVFIVRELAVGDRFLLQTLTHIAEANRVRVYSNDITERRQAEEKQAEERNLLRTLIDSMPDVIFTKDMSGRMGISNRAHVRFAGAKNEEELLGKTVFDLYPPDLAKAYNDADREVLDSGRPIVDREEPSVMVDGMERWLITTKVPLRNKTGEMVGLVGISRDITERRKTEQALRESEEHFRFLNDMNEATRTLSDPRKVMAVTARMLGQYLKVSRCAYADVEDDGDKFRILDDYTDGCASTVGDYHLSLFGPKAVATLTWGRTLIIRDVDRELTSAEGADMFNAIGIKAIIVCPLVKNGGLRAMMAVHQTTPRDWTPSEITVVQDVVERCWSTIERRLVEEQIVLLNADLERRVTERTAQLEAANGELSSKRAELQSLFESLPGPHLVLAPDFKVVAANDAYLKVTMTARESIVGRSLFDIFPDNPDDPNGTGSTNVRASFMRVLQNAAPDTMAIQKYDIPRPDGVFEERFWSPINSPVFGANQEVKYIVHRVEDVTSFVRQQAMPEGDSAQLRAQMERMQTEIYLSYQKMQEANRQLEAANAELEAFSYSVSHDLRAPLRAVDGFSQAVIEDYGPQLPDEGQRFLHTIRESAQRMGALIDDLLTFSRLSRLPMAKSSVDVEVLVRDVLADLNFKREGLDLRIGTLPPCKGDRALLKQVWLNLISNAFKYSGKNAAAIVEVGCNSGPEGSVYFVRDNGTGFDMRYADKLFGVFQRLHRVEDYEGTGVGLAIVQRIIHRHGGRIWADAAVGRGATFYFTVEGETKL